MVAEIGFGSLFISLIISVYGIIAAIYGVRNHQKKWILSAQQSMRLVFPLLTITVGSLIFLLIYDNFEVVYVSQVSSLRMPLYLKITALWGGQAGSLLFWSWLLAGFTSGVTLMKWDRDQDLLPWVIVVSLGTLAFFLVLNTFFENPFVRYWQVNQDIVQSFAQPVGGFIVGPRDGGRFKPAFTTSRHGHPSPHAVPGICGLYCSVCICYGLINHRPIR